MSADQSDGIRILNAEPEGYSDRARRVLRSFATLEEHPCDREELLDRVGAVDALIVRLGHRVDETVLSRAPRLQAVVTATTGLDHIDLHACERRDVSVLSLRGETGFLDTVASTAEHTWALLLGLVRHLPWAHQHVIGGGWERDRFRGHELSGKTLGILGLGRLGRKVARYGRAFGMEVLAHDRGPAENPGDVELLPLEALVERVDVLSVHLPLSGETEGLVGAEVLERMPSGGWLVNTARGAIVDEVALLDALRSGRLAGAALDVLASESSADDRSRPLLEYAREHDNVLITPHVGGATHEAMESTEVFMARKLREFFR